MANKVTANLENAVHPATEPDENDYEAQGHLRTLIDAHGIQSDEGKMEKVRKLAGRHHKAIEGIMAPKEEYKSLDQIKRKSNEMALKKGGR